MHTISMNFYMDKLKANLNLSVGNLIFSEWSEKILNIFKNGELLHIKSNNEIDALALQLKNFYPYDIDSFIDFKLKVTRLFFLILKKHSESGEKKDTFSNFRKYKVYFEKYSCFRTFLQ